MDSEKKIIKVLHIVHNFLQGGIEGFMWYLTNEQRSNPKLDITVLVCAAAGKVPNNRIPDNGINCIFIDVSPREINPKKFRSIRALTDSFDIIHFHIFIPPLAFALSTSTAKKVYTIHNAGHALRPATRLAPLKTFLFKRFINTSIDVIVNNSNYTKEYWLQNGIRKTNNFVIPNGVLIRENIHNPPDDILQEFPSLRNTFIIGTTSRLIKWKRVDLLIEAYSRMHNLPKARLLVVGDGEEKNAWKNKAADLGLQDSIIFTGYRKNVADFQNLMDVCVFPSVSEPFGLVAIECLSKGKPVVVMIDGGGLAEIVKEIEPENIADGVSELTRILDLKVDQRDELAAIADRRKEYSKKFSSKVMEEGYYQLYKKAIVSH